MKHYEVTNYRVKSMEAIDNIADVSTPELEASITGLCADLNAATYKQLVMVAEFDRRRGWGDDGVRSCAHWLNWKCGISLVAAREKVRVGHALAHLPNVSKAFASGELSYSKARAITRVGTVHNEDCLLSYAKYGTASQLDRTVRLYRKQFDSAGEPMADYQQPVFDADENVSQAGLSNAERFDAENQGAVHNRDYRQLTHYWDEHGCLILRARLTAEQGALVIKAMDAAMESLKHAEPSLDSGSHVLERDTKGKETAVVDLAADEGDNQLSNDEKFRLDRQQQTRRRADALVLMAEALLRDSKVASCTDDRYQVVVHVDSNLLAKQVFEKNDGSPDCYIDNQVGIPVETARRLSCSCKVVTALTNKGEPLSIGRSSRAIPTAIKRALDIRDTCCVFPGCDCHKHLDAHHIQHWANDGETSLWNLAKVCHHHHTLLHEGQYSVERLADGELLFKRPDGSVLQSRDATDRGGDLPATRSEPWSWCGDSMDYDMALFALASQTRESVKNAGLYGA